MVLGLLETNWDGAARSRRPHALGHLDPHPVDAGQAGGGIPRRVLLVFGPRHASTQAPFEAPAHRACSADFSSAASENAMQSCPKNISYPEPNGQLSLPKGFLARHGPKHGWAMMHGSAREIAEPTH